MSEKKILKSGGRERERESERGREREKQKLHNSLDILIVFSEGQLYRSGGMFGFRSAGEMIEPASGGMFHQNFFSLAHVSSYYSSFTVQLSGLKHHLFHLILVFSYQNSAITMTVYYVCMRFIIKREIEQFRQYP